MFTLPRHDLCQTLGLGTERIQEIRRLCREDRSKVTDELCLRAAEAAKRRFYGNKPEQGAK